VAAIDAIHSHLERGNLHDGLVFDAVRLRLIEIGEAVKAHPAELLARQPALPWAQIAGMRDRLTRMVRTAANGADGRWRAACKLKVSRVMGAARSRPEPGIAVRDERRRRCGRRTPAMSAGRTRESKGCAQQHPGGEMRAIRGWCEPEWCAGGR